MASTGLVMLMTPGLALFYGGLVQEKNLWTLLQNVGFEPNADYAPTVPHLGYMLFELMFAIITPAIISGAVAERITFKAWLIFVVAWTTLVYDPLGHCGSTTRCRGRRGRGRCGGT
jgi:Amt family ammonium transporter